MEQIRLQCQFTLPEYIMPSYWTRHKLSRAAVVALLETCECPTLWKLALHLGSTVPPHVLRPSNYRAHEVLVSGKALAIDTVLTGFTYWQHPSEYVNVLYAPCAVPIYLVDLELYSMIVDSLGTGSQYGSGAVAGAETNTFVFQHNGLAWVPHSLEDSGALCSRVEKIHLECSPQLTTELLWLRRPVVEAQGLLYAVTQERVLFCTSATATKPRN
jgi:hypothetical protein